MQALPLGHHEQARELSTRWYGPPTARFNLAVVVIAAVNVAAALAMISYILFDARILARSLRVQRVFHVHPAEVFPLIISVAIVVQGIVFLIAQSLTFPTNFTPIQLRTYCEALPQILWPSKKSQPSVR